MFRYLIGILTFMALSSCLSTPPREMTLGQKTHFSDITDNEDGGIRAVLNLYGGKCNYSKGVAASGDFGDKKYFELIVSNSASLNQRRNLSELSGSNIAYLFYEKLKGERKNYAEIRTGITYDDDEEEYKATYSDSILNIVVAKMKVVSGIVELLKGKNYVALADTLNDSNFFDNFNKKEFAEHIAKVDSSLGDVKEFVPYGFSFSDSVEHKILLHISGLIRREKKNNEFNVTIDPASADNKAIMIKYAIF